MSINSQKIGVPKRLPALPSLLSRKIFKTGQTRGADDDEIFQNRVSRSSTVLIPFSIWKTYYFKGKLSSNFKNGFIVLISPDEYFGSENIDRILLCNGLILGINALVFYETRAQWDANNPIHLGWKTADSRLKPLGGKFVARIPATTAIENGKKIVMGFNTTSRKGAGIRVYEYANDATIADCRDQLEALFWLCYDALEVAVFNNMTKENALLRRKGKIEACKTKNLLNMDKLREARIVNNAGHTICPLCLEQLSSRGFFNRMAQAEGRMVLDLTVTQLNLFHIEELCSSKFNHRPYNLGWGHHHCNVVVKDTGISETLRWMHEIVQRNIMDGHYSP